MEKKFQKHRPQQNNRYEDLRLKYNQLIAENANKDAEGKNQIADIKKIAKDYDNFCKIVDQNWEKKILKNVEIKVGNPITTNANAVKVVIVEPHDKLMESKIQKLYKDRFPELQNLEDSCDYLEQEKTKVNNKITTSKRRVFKLQVQEDEKSIFEAI